MKIGFKELNMAILHYNFNNSDLSKSIDFQVNTAKVYPSETERVTRFNDFKNFAGNLIDKFEMDLTGKQLIQLGELLKALRAPYEYGNLDFSLKEVLAIESEKSVTLLKLLGYMNKCVTEKQKTPSTSQQQDF